MTIPQAGAAAQDPRAATWRDRVAKEVAAIVAAELDKVDLTDPSQAEFAHIERTVRAIVRQVGGILCGRWAQGAADVLAARPTCPGCQKVMAIVHRAAVTRWAWSVIANSSGSCTCARPAASGQHRPRNCGSLALASCRRN